MLRRAYVEQEIITIFIKQRNESHVTPCNDASAPKTVLAMAKSQELHYELLEQTVPLLKFICPQFSFSPLEVNNL